MSGNSLYRPVGVFTLSANTEGTSHLVGGVRPIERNPLPAHLAQAVRMHLHAGAQPSRSARLTLKAPSVHLALPSLELVDR